MKYQNDDGVVGIRYSIEIDQLVHITISRRSAFSDIADVT
jgi:hypothetical protein